MSEPLFQPMSKSVEFSNSALKSFKDCPNRCVDGFVVDPYTHKRSVCPYCEAKRKEVVRNSLVDENNNKNIEQMLNLHILTSMSGYTFNPDIIIPEFAMKYLQQDSVNNVISIMKSLVEKVSNGILPDHSMLFNLGTKSCPNNFVYPYLINAYIAGLSVVPFLNVVDLQNLRKGYTWKEINGKDEKDIEFYDITFNDVLRRDIFVVKLDAGCTKNDINFVKGLMQLRADFGKATIIFTEVYNYDLNLLKAEDNAEFLHLATTYEVQYNERGKKEEAKYLSSSTSPASVTGTEFNKLFGH